MKKSILFGLCLLGLINSVEAKAFFGRVYHYLNVPQNEVIELSEYDIDRGSNSATYFDYRTHKKVTVSFSDLSRETDLEMNDVSSGEFILFEAKGQQRPCQVYYLFENAMALIGCKSDKMNKAIGVQRPIIEQYVLHSVFNQSVTAEVKELNNFKKHDFVTINKDIGKLKSREKVRIEVIFSNGEALVEDLGISFLDTSSVLMKYNIEKVQLIDLELD